MNKRKKQQMKIDRLEQYDSVTNIAREIFERKNKDYGNSFAIYGPVGVIVRLGDKIQRLSSVSKNGITFVESEKLEDTLFDLANYAKMALMLLKENQFQNVDVPPDDSSSSSELSSSSDV